MAVAQLESLDAVAHVIQPAIPEVQFEHVLFDMDVDDSTTPKSFDAEPFLPQAGWYIRLPIPVGV